jgi:hypothetical protein
MNPCSVSIIVDSKITNIFNLAQMVNYAKERGLTCEIVKNVETARGKYIFEYDPGSYYFDYTIHWAFLRLEMPMGYQPGDPDLPERLYWSKTLVCDGHLIGVRAQRYSDFYLRKFNKFNNFIEESNNIARCVRGHVESISNVDSNTRDMLIKFFDEELVNRV